MFTALNVTLLSIYIPYLVFLITRSITFAAYLPIPILLVGLFANLKQLKEKKSLLLWFFILGILIYYGVDIILRPVSFWDARSIWFFQAKILYFEKGIGSDSYLTNPLVTLFAHSDYPKLLPFHAAAPMHLIGFWNEYLPKIGLLLLFLPVAIFTASFSLYKIRYVLFTTAIFIVFNKWIWFGYLDFYLAFYALLALVFLERFQKSAQLSDLFTSILSISITLSLKNEGMLLFLLYIVAFIFILKTNYRYYLSLLFPLLLLVLWSLIKKDLHLTNDLTLGIDSIPLILNRLNVDSLKMITNAMFLTKGFYLWLLTTLCIVVYVRSLSLKLLVGLLYFAAIFIIYLATPHDLGWHLATSAERTIFPTLIIIIYELFDKLPIRILDTQYRNY